MVHVVIIDPGLVTDVLAGRKTIETRLSARRVAPFEMIKPGDRIYFKRRGGAFGATAIASHVEFYTNLTPAKVASLHRIYDERVLGSDRFWRSKRNAKFGTFVHLSQVEATELAPDYRASPAFNPRTTWHAMPDSMDIYPSSAAA